MTLVLCIDIIITIKIYLSVWLFSNAVRLLLPPPIGSCWRPFGLWARLYRHLAVWRRYFGRVTILCYYWSKMSPSPCWPMAPLWPPFARAQAPPSRSVPQRVARTNARTHTLRSVMLSAAWVMRRINLNKNRERFCCPRCVDEDGTERGEKVGTCFSVAIIYEHTLTLQTCSRVTARTQASLLIRLHFHCLPPQTIGRHGGMNYGWHWSSRGARREKSESF